MIEVTVETNCRVCGGKLKDVLNLGYHYPSTFVKEQPEQGFKIPLIIAKCTHCGLAQLRQTLDADLMYKKQYWYKSSLNSSMVKDLYDVVTNIETIISLNPGDIVVDIGANDGTMLDLYAEKDLIKVGFDPAENLNSNLKNICQYFIHDYFNANAYDEVLKQRAKVVTSIAVFYDLPSPTKFVADVDRILAPDGVWVIQFSDLKSTLEKNMLDNVCFEHIEYYTIKDIENLIKPVGMKIFRISHNKVNGGSLRFFICRVENKRYRLDKTSAKIKNDEDMFFQTEWSTFEEFEKRIKTNKIMLMNILKFIKASGKTIYGLGASTKGNTLLQYCEIDKNIIPYILEVHPDKIGLKTIGTDIEIIEETEENYDKADYLLVMPWHFRDHFINKFKKYLDDGKYLIFPLPWVEVIGKEKANGN